MYVIVVGGGKVGFYLTKTLLAEGYEVLLIERSGDKVERFQEQFGAIVIAGDGAEAQTLKAAGAARADVVIAVTGEDEDNLVICQIAKQKFHVARTIARVNNPKNEQLFNTLGIDVTVSQTNHILHLIEQSIPGNTFIHLLSLAHPDLAIVDARIDEASPVAERSIGEIGLPPNCMIAAVCRGKQLITPTPATEILPGDDVIAIAHRDQEEELRHLLVS
jgi:trk system potassium uptake protein TrkA